MVEQQAEPVLMVEGAGLGIGGKVLEALGRAAQAEGAELIESGMREHAIWSFR